MKIYSVGGAVRDELLGLPVKDHDYVVVGANVGMMLAAGYKPVGADFPVFLHPETHAEYALARTERKTAPGYRGFVFHTATNVTLEQDLRRRDLTINAMARDAHTQTLIDPFGGEADLHHRLLRHVSDAFAEDPVRILRTARFAARFADLGFKVAEETTALMQTMVNAGEVDHLVPERVWQELARGLMTPRPSAMFAVLRSCGALARILPELDALWGVPQSSKHHPEIDTGIHISMVIDHAAKVGATLPVRFACLTHDLGKASTPSQYLPHHPDHGERGVAPLRDLCERLRVPQECRDLAICAARLHGDIHRAPTLDAEGLLAIFDGADALRRPERFHALLEVAASDHHGRLGFGDLPYPPQPYLQAALQAINCIDFGAVAQAASEIAPAVRAAKLAALQTFINQPAPEETAT